MHRWDQKLCCGTGKVKSFFGRKFRMEAEENDLHRKGGTTAPPLTAKEARAERQKRSEILSHKNVQCKLALIQALTTCHRSSPGIEEAKETHFAKVAPKLLAAFVKCCVLDDACLTAMEKMPKKGTLKDARNKVSCPKTGKLVLIKWAFNLRSQPVKASILPPTPQQAAREENRLLYLRGINEAQEDFDFLDDQNTNLMAHTDAGIEEQDVFGFPAEEEDSDEEDDCEFEGGDDDDYEDDGE
jgi:hypothetical protein